MIAIDLSKKQVFDADPKIMQQINFIGTTDIYTVATVFFFALKEPQEIISSNSLKVI